MLLPNALPNASRATSTLALAAEGKPLHPMQLMGAGAAFFCFKGKKNYE
jgi:hypothetical protein